MLTDLRKAELRGEVFRGCLLPVVARARLEMDPAEYNDICNFIITELRSFHRVPHDRHARFFIEYRPFYGQVITCGPWHPDGRSEFQFCGEATLHPAPSLVGSPPLAAKKILGVRYRPKHETRRAPSGESVIPDFKTLAAGDN